MDQRVRLDEANDTLAFIHRYSFAPSSPRERAEIGGPATRRGDGAACASAGHHRGLGAPFSALD